ncbi:MAG: DUF4331 family protein [Rhizobacter sp.]|nr:DUF4331 family protein [Bacteriovorax sp.]
MLVVPTFTLHASDHDDGVTSIKPASRNLTDLYVFREDQQTGVTTDSQNMILIMNSNPRSPAGIQRYFSTNSTYEFHITALSADEKNSAPTGRDDQIIQFKFSEPDEKTHVQKFSMYVIKGGKSVEVTPDEKGPLKPKFQSTSIVNSKNEKLTFNNATYDNNRISVFAGLREDPFFFDVDQFFKVRMGALGEGPKVGFRDPATAVDFTIGYNVNTIVVQLPIAMLKAGTEKPIFDVWETVTSTSDKKQVERLARPAINEGLVVSNDFLNAFNMIPPSADLSAAAAPVVNEAANSIVAFDMLDGKTDTTVAQVANAFLPDVMRVDSRLDLAVATTAYNADVSGDRGMLTGGRKLEDDVMDITLSFLVAGDATGAAVKDNVSYEGTPGNPNQGHKLLYKQTERKGPASFPFLAKPN